MSHTLTWNSDPYAELLVNGFPVEQPYSLKNGDTISLFVSGERYQPGPGPMPPHNKIYVNNTEYFTETIALSDTDIDVYFEYFDRFSVQNTVNINYSESGGGGSMLDVTYNSVKIIDSLEVTPPVAVTYNGSTIATLNEGDTKTLQCNGKVMASNVVIGDKTLQCNGKLMASDVVVEVGG